jgi:hypothetical protein
MAHLKPIERELGALLSMERLMQSFLRKHTRPNQPHRPIRDALDHVIAEKSLLQMAMNGDVNAIKARRIPDANAIDALGE